MRNSNDYAEHLSDIGDGIGCTEIWEHLSDRRAKAKAGEAEEHAEAVDREVDEE